MRDEEARGTRIALPSGAPAKLIVDSPALMTLGPDDVQSTEFRNFFAEPDVGAASGHIGGDGDGSALPGLRDDGRLIRDGRA